MKPEYQLLHQDMLADIDRCMQLELTEGERAENCFWIANSYWDRLKDFMKDRVFKTENEEIEFFRNVKPQFTLYIEYFILLSEALMFVPVDKENAIKYWEEELNRFSRFCNKNLEFVKYYESGCNSKDRIHFLRSGCTDLRYIPKAPVYDIEEEFCSGGDQLVRSYLAYKKYNEYALKRLELVTMN